MGDGCVCSRHETLEYRVKQLENTEEKRANNKNKAVYLVYAQIVAAAFMLITAFFTSKDQKGGGYDPYRETSRGSEHRSRGNFSGRGDRSDSSGFIGGRP